MAPTLTPCPSCDRHVRADEARCAFCGAELAAKPAGATGRRLAGPLTRAALFAGATALAAASSACGPRTDNDENIAQPYGAPPPPPEPEGTEGDEQTGSGEGSGDETGDPDPDTTTIVPPYGAPAAPPE